MQMDGLETPAVSLRESAQILTVCLHRLHAFYALLWLMSVIPHASVMLEWK